jgi:hypothetical protein
MVDRLAAEKGAVMYDTLVNVFASGHAMLVLSLKGKAPPSETLLEIMRANGMLIRNCLEVTCSGKWLDDADAAFAKIQGP